jgi:hypothetical protein
MHDHAYVVAGGLRGCQTEPTRGRIVTLPQKNPVLFKKAAQTRHARILRASPGARATSALSFFPEF